LKQSNIAPRTNNPPTAIYVPEDFKKNTKKRGRGGKRKTQTNGDNVIEFNEDDAIKVIQSVKIKKDQLSIMDNDSANEFAKSIASSVKDKKLELYDICKYLMDKVNEEVNKLNTIPEKRIYIGRKKLK
jgi:hypothetical protein